MSDVVHLVKQATDKINAENTRIVERRVEVLVDNILAGEAELQKVTADIAKWKAELKQLQLPAVVAVEL
jgi:uncharacterized protein YydD (DUF2326 family)